MLKKCRLLWREARVEVKMYKARQLRSTFGSWDVEEVHVTVEWSTFDTFGSEHVQNTAGSGHFCQLRCSKVYAVVAQSTHQSQKSKVLKSDRFGPLLEVRSSKNCTPFWREAHFEVLKTEGPGRFFEVRMRFCVAGVMDSAPCQKWVKRVGFAACSKPMAGVGQLKMICKDGFRVAGAVQETFSSEMLRGQGADTTLHYATLHCTAVHYTTLHYVHYAYSYNYN